MGQRGTTNAFSEEIVQELRMVSSLVSLLALAVLDHQALSPVLPEIAIGLGVSVQSIGMTVSGYAIAAALAGLIIGPLSDVRGRKEFLLIAGLTFTVGSLVVWNTSSFYCFAIARVVSGSAAGVFSTLIIAAISDRVPYKRRGRAMGWLASTYFAAPILGVPLTAWIADHVGWRTNYLLFALVAVILTAVVRFWFLEITPGVRKLHSVSSRWSYFRFFRERSTASGALSAFFVSGGLTGFVLYLGTFLRDRYGMSVTEVGLVFFLSGSMSLVGAVGAGRVADRCGKRNVALAGSIGVTVLLPLTPIMTLPSLYVVLGLIGLSGAARVAPLQSLVTELVVREERGAFVALRNTMSQLGIATAAAVAGVLYNYGFDRIAWFTSGLSFVGVLLLLLIREPLDGKKLEL